MHLPESRMPIKLAAEPDPEARYRAAKARLLAAQQEKIEAADEFLAARAALYSEAEAAHSHSGRRIQGDWVPRNLGWGTSHA